MSLSRRFVFAGTYHRESPGEKNRKIVADDEKTQHIHAGALDPIGFGWAAYELMLNYGFDIVAILHDKDASALKEVRRVKQALIQTHPELKLSTCVCNGDHFETTAPSSLTKNQKKEITEHPEWNGEHFTFCSQNNDGMKGSCHTCEDFHCIRHGKVNFRKAIPKTLKRLMGENAKVRKKNASAKAKHEKAAKKKATNSSSSSSSTAGTEQEEAVEPPLVELPIPYPELEGLNKKTHELYTRGLAIGRYVASIWDQVLIFADGNVELVHDMQPEILRHITNQHDGNRLCTHYGKCQEPGYAQTMVISDEATLVVVKDVLRRWGMKKTLKSYANRFDTNALESLNFITINFLAKLKFSQNTTLYSCVAKFMLLYANEGGAPALRHVMEALDLDITCELSNYLTLLETKSKADMTRKTSESGRARRVQLREERKEQTADKYRKDISAGTHQRPGAAIEWQEPQPEVNLDVDMTAEENEEEMDAGTSASVEVESMMDDEEAQKKGESVAEVEFMFETMNYCNKKNKREMGINDMPVSRSSRSGRKHVKFDPWRNYK